MSERKPQFVHLYLTKSVGICDRNKLRRGAEITGRTLAI